MLLGEQRSRGGGYGVSSRANQERKLLTRNTALHVSARRDAVSNFLFPAMSPTMTEGGIASWKKKEGDTFEAGDILLEIVGSYADKSDKTRQRTDRRVRKLTKRRWTWKLKIVVFLGRS